MPTRGVGTRALRAQRADETFTGGHFFKLVISNSVRFNPAQFVAGTPFSFDTDEWRLGFDVTRLLQF